MITQYFNFLKEVLDKLIENHKELNDLINALLELQRNNGRLFVIGVGGSAGMASHAVNDFRKLCEIEAYCPTDNVCELTARTNDEGFETIFSEYLRISRLTNKDGVLVISVGGGDVFRGVSMNIVKALSYAKLQKAKIWGIVGRDGGYTKGLADICIVIPNLYPLLVTPITETFHNLILHTIIFHPTLQVNEGKWESLKYIKSGMKTGAQL